MATRRALLAALAAAPLAPSALWAEAGAPTALTGARDAGGQFQLIGLTGQGAIAFRIPLPARGHAAAAHPTQAEAVFIARRPGTYALVIDCATGALRQTLTAPQGRHFYGHAAFSADGKTLFTTESDIATGAGRIGAWDRRHSFARIDEFASGGIGPHEILRLPSGDLAVANGGIRTHPDRGRDKLNLDTMHANLTVLSPGGTVLRQAHTPPEARLNSLRHIAAGPDGTVACAFQWQGDPFDAPSLLALSTGEDLEPVPMASELLHGLDGYIGSVAATGPETFAATAPRGGRLIRFDRLRGVTQTHRATDVCGVTSSRQGALATDGLGRIHTLAPWSPLAAHTGLAFDNHLIAI